MTVHGYEGVVFENRQYFGISNVVLALAVVFVVSRIVKYRRGLHAVSNLPGLRSLFFPMGLPGAIIPTIWWNPGLRFTWFWRDTLYKKFNTDTISFVPYLFGPPTIYTSNINVARQVASGSKERSFWKPEWASAIVLEWGMNLFAADGDIWRTHRRVMGPAFNNELYKFVWSETLKTYREMIDAEGFTDKTEVSIPKLQFLTFKFALIIIGRCGFGFNFNWSEPATTPDGKMSVQEALTIVARSLFINIVLPKPIRKFLPFKKIRQLCTAHERLMAFFHAQIAERKDDIRSGKFETRSGGKVSQRNWDAFSMLVQANEDEEEEEGGKFKLSDEELIGNIYLMLFAGHETTAHSLAATIGYLAYYPELQKEVYEQIISVVGHDRDPEFEDYNALDKVLHAFFEALRLIPSAYTMFREAYEDTVLQIPKPQVPKDSDETITIPISKGTIVIVDMIGMQYNPRYFTNPTEYIPSRWTGVTVESEAFSAFSIGPRACIGRKFATTEAVGFLTMLLRDFHVEPLLEVGETRERWKERVLEGEIIMTLGVKSVPVRFVRRKTV